MLEYYTIMTFISALKVNIKGEEYIFAISDSKAIEYSKFLPNKIIENKQKINYVENKEFIFLIVGVVTNIKSIANLNNVNTTNEYLSTFKKLVDIQKDNSRWKSILFGFNKNNRLDLNVISNENNNYEYFNLNQYFVGSGFRQLLEKNLVPSKFKNNQILKYKSFFLALLDMYNFAKFAYQNDEEKNVNDIFQFAFMSKNGVSVLHNPIVKIENFKGYLEFNFDKMKPSKELLNNFYSYLETKINLYLNSNENTKKEIENEVNSILIYFILKDANNFFNKYIELNIDSF